MTTYDGDRSVLVKRHILELGSAWFSALVDPSANHRLVSSQIRIVEVTSAFNRRRREGRITNTDYVRLAADFAALCVSEYRLLDLTNLVIERARELLEHHPLRAYDSVQLASALIANEALVAAGQSVLTFLAADDRLLAAARAEG
jgi:predicted nucleic acid-binding protein